MAFDPVFYGFGFLIGAALFYLVTLFRLDAFTANLPYRVLGQQPIVAQTKRGRFTELGILLEHGEQRVDQSLHRSGHARSSDKANIAETDVIIGRNRKS